MCVQIRERLCQLAIPYFPALLTMKFFFLLIVEYIRLLHETKKYNALFPLKLCTTVLQLSNVTEMVEAEMGRSQMTVKGKSKVKFVLTSV